MRIEEEKSQTPLCLFHPQKSDSLSLVLGGLVRFGNLIHFVAVGKRIFHPKITNLPKITKLCLLHSIPGPKIIIEKLTGLKKSLFGDSTLVAIEWAGNRHNSHVVHKSKNPEYNFVIPLVPEDKSARLTGIIKRHDHANIDHDVGTFEADIDVTKSGEITVPVVPSHSGGKTMSIKIKIQSG